MRKLLLLAIWGCGGVHGGESLQAAGGLDAGVDGGPAIYDEEPNGRWILGAALDVAPYTPAGATQYFSVGTAATRRGVLQKVTFAGAASLTSSGADGVFGGIDKRFDELVFVEGALRVTIAVAGGTASVTQYSLDVQNGNDPIARVCDAAIPLTGVIDRTGKHVATPNRITFACGDGAASKCAAFGYPAGASGSQFWGAHQGCMQMVTANYCADGVPATRVGTSIRFYDNAGVYQIPDGTQIGAITAATWPPNPDDYYFEAAFTGLHTEAVCLARLRWPIFGSSCAATLPDCTGGTVDALIDPHGALLFVASKYNQLRLDRWQKRAGSAVVDRVATVRGYFNAGDLAIKPPWDGYTYEGRDGVLLRVPPDSVPATALHEVSLFRTIATAERFVARSNDVRFANAQVFANDGFEGYVYRDPSPGRTALRMYKRTAATTERLASTLDPADAAGLGYIPDLDSTGTPIIGWIAPAP